MLRFWIEGCALYIVASVPELVEGRYREMVIQILMDSHATDIFVLGKKKDYHSRADEFLCGKTEWKVVDGGEKEGFDRSENDQRFMDK